MQACCSSHVVFRRCVLQKNFHGGGCYVSKLHLQECQGPRFQSRALLFISNARTKNVANKESGVCRANFLIKTQTLSSMLSKPASSILKKSQTNKKTKQGSVMFSHLVLMAIYCFYRLIKKCCSHSNRRSYLQQMHSVVKINKCNSVYNGS